MESEADSPSPRQSTAAQSDHSGADGWAVDNTDDATDAFLLQRFMQGLCGSAESTLNFAFDS